MTATVEGYPGIAWHELGRCDEHHNCTVMVMVGDDVPFHHDADDVTPIDETEFCHECGQVGCSSNVPDST